ncbi:peptide-methionine (R)-S-oxide reductase MsrB [Pseudomonas sp. NPDC007930]|uniref:peptide-methionine (R)-S-oxide reductase MsrB n=1 Tax=Pseudomonas sp. NPDC007930 TaxID=3364417 RepID=UPI0036EE880B
MLSRRQLLLTSGALGASALALGALPRLASSAAQAPEDDAVGSFEVHHSDAEWRQRLSAEQYQVLRQEGTERPYSSPLNDEHRAGSFACAGCQLALFASATKFDSHTGWPSFWAPLANAVGQRTDRTYGMLRKEVHCRRCGGHLGHVFDDGPAPTGLRYCMNGAAMTFTAQVA